MRTKGQILREELADLTPDLQIDLICDRFEQDIWAGMQPDLADYLTYIDERYRPQLFVELLLVDWELRTHDDCAPDWRVYQARFPNYASKIEEARLRQRTPIASPPAAANAPSIGHFLLLESLGEGTSGKVWKALDPRLHRTVAVKIPRALRLSDNALNRFLREGRAAAQLNHPRIVPAYEVGREGDAVYIVSAYVPGQNLRDWLSSSRPTAREAAVLCAQLADALDHAHERGVIHRDLKPSNVILDADRNPHITDFGLAKCANDQSEMTLEGELVGTPAYMSPEQASGKAISADRRTDVYALGVILYEMLTGRPPFDADPSTIIQQVIHQDPLHPRRIQRSIPRDLETICLKAMSKSPDDRYWSAQEMAMDLRRLLDGRPIVARPPNLFERVWLWIRRRPAVAAMFALAVLLAGTLAFASHLAVEKHAMLGLRTIKLDTSPAGAKITLVPLDVNLGEALPEKVIRSGQRSPVALEVPEGDYLVVAVLDDGRFHEVYRHVPKQTEALGGVYAHRRWDIAADQSVQLPAIVIPDHAITENMAQIKGPQSDGGVYIDCYEFTVDEYRRLSSGKDPQDKRWQSVPDDFAVAVGFDDAVALAERSGKRLPTEREFICAALRRKPVRASAIDSESEGSAHGVGPVGYPTEDRTNTVPAVIGLCSNVAEWTTSRPGNHAQLGAEGESPWMVEFRARVVCGGNRQSMHGESLTTEIHRPDSRVAVTESTVCSGLGFRCVRSIAPRFADE